MSGLLAQSDDGIRKAEASRFTPAGAFEVKNEMLACTALRRKCRSFLAQHDMLSAN